MRIALFHNLPSGGGKRALYEWVRRLSEKHDFNVFTLNTADHEFCDLRPYVKNYIIYPYQSRKRYQSPFGRLNKLKNWLDLGDLERENKRIAEEINKSGNDIVFANTCMFTYIPALLKYVEKPSLYYLHEPFGRNFKRNISRPYESQRRISQILDPYDPLIKLYETRLTNIQKDSLQNTRLLLANSHYTKDQMLVEFGVQAQFSPLGVDTETFYPMPEIPKENMVVSVGELSPRKGFDFLIESLARVRSDVRPMMTIACNTIQEVEKNYITQLAKDKEVELEILSSLDATQLRTLYNRSKFCIYSPYLEPFGLVPLEAMACGIPVIGVCEGGVKESIAHDFSGLLVRRDGFEFAGAVEKLMGDENLLKQYGDNARHHVQENWSIDLSTDKLEGFFLKLLEQI